ncbi:MAG: His/Gly/Thr/Pro-type tRNA ligase C-terminal domain-containing protein, partial [Acidobacteriota bacterium]
NSILGGGRYDGLVEELGGPKIPGFGFAAGMERIVMLLPDDVPEGDEGKPHLFIATMSEQGFNRGIEICMALRRKGIRVSMATETKSLNVQMRAANRENATFVIFIGDEEIRSGAAGIKDMRSGKQRSVGLEEIESLSEGFRNVIYG